MDILLKTKIGPVLLEGLPDRVQYGNSIDGYTDQPVEWSVHGFEEGAFWSVTGREHPFGTKHYEMYVNVGESALENAKKIEAQEASGSLRYNAVLKDR